MTGLLASALFLTQTVLKGGRRLKGVVIARGSKIGIDAGAEDRHDGMIRGEVQCREDHVLSHTYRSSTSLLLEIHRDISSCNTLRRINLENINVSHATHTHMGNNVWCLLRCLAHLAHSHVLLSHMCCSMSSSHVLQDELKPSVEHEME